MSKETGGSAFPHVVRHVSPDTYESLTHGGMSLRDYFAAKAMNGMCAHVDTWGMTVPQIAKRAYDLADEMLRAREAS